MDLKQKRAIKISIVFLLLSITIAFFLIYDIRKNEKYRILTIGKRFRLISFNRLNDSSFKLYDYPEKEILASKKVEIIKNSTKNEFYIMKYPDSGDGQIYQINFNDTNLITPKATLIYDNLKWGFNKPEYLIEVDSSKNCFYGSYGTVHCYKDKMEVDSENLWKIDKQLALNDGMAIKSELLVCQTWFKLKKEKFSDEYFGGLMGNRLFLVSLKDRKILKTIDFGFSPKSSQNGVSGDLEAFSLPLSLSPEKDKLIFMARVLKTHVQEGDSDPAPLWLCLLNLKTYKIEKIVKISCSSGLWMFTRKIPIDWNTDNGKSLITFSLMNSIIDVNKEPQNISMIIDIDKKKIIKSWPWESKSMRWSPDGKYLGMLRMKSRNSDDSDNEKEAGSLYVYELKTDTLKKIDQNKTGFEFYWLE